jgi:methionine-rich copper-binding protein CopC
LTSGVESAWVGRPQLADKITRLAPAPQASKVGKTLPPGVHTLTWRAVSVDTHHTQGDFQFAVTP